MSRSSSPSDEVPVDKFANLNIDASKVQQPTGEENKNDVSESSNSENDTNDDKQDVEEMANPALDAVILAALRKPQDRMFLLKLDLEFENFINNPARVRLDFPQMNSYQRLIVHRVATYFKLTHLFDPVRRSIYLCKNVSTEVPSVRFADLVEKEEEPVSTPKFQIMQRATSDRGHRKGDVSPGDGNLSSDGKNALNRKQMTLEERQVAYEEARARIFQDFGPNSAEGSEVEGDNSQASSNISSPAIKDAGKKISGRSSPVDNGDDAGTVRTTPNRGKPFTARTQSNSKRPSPRDKESNADGSPNPQNRLDPLNRFPPQPYIAQQPLHPAYQQQQQQQQSLAYNSRPFGYAPPYTSPVYDPYNGPQWAPGTDVNANPNFSNYWKQPRPQSAANSTVSPHLTSPSSSSLPPSQPLSRVWSSNTNASNDSWSPSSQEFPAIYNGQPQNLGMRPQRPNISPGTGGHFYNTNANYSNPNVPFQDRRSPINGQMNNGNGQPAGVWSNRPDNRDWGPLW
ncbi:hypothetical protein INT43_003328 [Umbelopsis isabellina]|uniref:R3H domain-containing protein 2 n=1 Tax=Mortierella isabellina TaxID=91625 RepID=A0A8H7PQJ3_MORIS|nr:hypothetical protein INT43_003328 [Umbelopsis isabellina]